jgi:ELP3 family radical SAM enzyme/protein acetyltransferase
MNLLKSKATRSLSGILQVAIMTDGKQLGCDEDCYFCPKQKNYPRSYLKEEPGTKRAEQEGFDPVRQTRNRLTSYTINGHDIDKLEIIIIGGTWSFYKPEYQEKFITGIYYAANTWFHPREEMYDLETEQKINETAFVKIIGLSIETRPDYIVEKEVMSYIKYGVTRVQVGVQTLDDRLLKKVNRGCYSKHTRHALKNLHDSCLKSMIHIMPNLPGTTPEIDKHTFMELIHNPDYQADEWKIYPTSVTTTSDKDIEKVNTVIEKWYLEGSYVPYDNETLKEVIKTAKREIGEETRIARVFRDIPKPNIIGGANIPHLRQIIQKEMAEDGEFCKCIRCREIKNINFKKNDITYKYSYKEVCGGVNYFISANVPPNDPKNPYKSTLVGFIRLRIRKSNNFIKVLDNCALIRELHVYGEMVPTYMKSKISNSQHRGVGSKLIKMAEEIAINHGLKKMAIISGVGVRGYYRKFGYELEEHFMTKKLSLPLFRKENYGIFFVIIMLMSIFIKICYRYFMATN